MENKRYRTVVLEKPADDRKYNKWRWLIMGVVLIAAIMGALVVTGNDPFPEMETDSKQVVESSKILRNQRETFIKFRLQEFEGVTQIAIPENYLSQFKINLIYPQPQYKQLINGNIVYTYYAEDDRMVTFYLEPRNPGRVKGSILVGDQSYTLTHLVYP